jgi:hypothetical protein
MQIHPPSHPRRFATLLTMAALAAASGHTLGQEIPDLEEPEIETEPPPLVAVPGLQTADFRIRPGPVVPEGTFVYRERGRLVALPTAERAFVFTASEGQQARRPMVLIPSLTLQRMEQATEGREVDFLVSGEVFAYRGVNYLLPTYFVLTPRAEPTPVPVPVPDPDPVEALIRDLEQQRHQTTPSPGLRPGDRTLPPSPALAETQDPAGTRQTAASPTLLPEGEVLVRRRARLVRQAGGEWAVVFDTGPEQEPAFDRPLVLTPSLTLQRMQAWAGRLGDTVTLEISGRITQYRGRNYLIPSVFRVYPSSTPLEPIH